MQANGKMDNRKSSQDFQINAVQSIQTSQMFEKTIMLVLQDKKIKINLQNHNFSTLLHLKLSEMTGQQPTLTHNFIKLTRYKL